VQVLDSVEIQPRKTHWEKMTWPQVDMRGRAVEKGEYFLSVRCNADDFPVEERKLFAVR
jgi:hypothetical protein